MRTVACFLLGLSVAGLPAQETPDHPPEVTYGPYPLTILQTSISSSVGTPAAKAELDSPFPDDFPPHTTIAFQDARKFPAFQKGARYFTPAGNNVTVYRITQVEKAPYRRSRVTSEN